MLRLVCCVAVFWGIVWVGGVTHVTTAAAGSTATLTMKPVVIIGKVIYNEFTCPNDVELP